MIGKKKEVKKHPAAVALDKFYDSEEGRKCLEGITYYGNYLRNRLYRAFMAGWKAKEKAK